MSANINNNFIGKAPAKLIISGEHSVVYGSPALVVAVKKFTKAKFLKTNKGKIETFINDENYPIFTYPSDFLGKIKKELDRNYEKFSEGKIAISEILKSPSDLIIYVLAHFSPPNLKISADLLGISEIPLGAGMGSSASAISAVCALCEKLFNKNLSLEERFNFVRYCERLQHGKGSALDASAVVFGGLNYLKEGRREKIEGFLEKGWFYFLDGKPQSSTGECVAMVREKFIKDKKIWQDFSATTEEIKKDVLAKKLPLKAISENQKLLKKIGIVAEATDRLIKKIENLGFAAKVSGAGTIKGNFSGMVLVCGDDEEKLKILKNNIPQLSKLEIEEFGAKAVRSEE